MKKIFSLIVMRIIQFTLKVRYRVHYKGLETLNAENLNRPGGVLFLPNHPTVFVDPSLVTIGVQKRFPIRPLVVEYMYYTTGIHWLMKFMKAIPIPNMRQTTNSVKIRRSERALEEVVKGLAEGDNFLIYPAGKVKLSNYELIGGSSGIHTLLQAAPNTNVVLVRITGLYGSSFSSAFTGKAPYMFPTIFRGVWAALKNFIFLTPKRDVTIEYCVAPKDFPYQSSRIVLNRYLEQWYNRPDGIDPLLAKKSCPGESLYLVPYSRWSSALPLVDQKQENSSEGVSLESIPKAIQEKVTAKLAEIADMSVQSVKPDMVLASDLGLDSLDASEILTFLQDSFGVVGVPPSALTTVKEVMGIAAKKVVVTPEEQEAEKKFTRWQKSTFPHVFVKMAEGKTIPEVFLNQCTKMGSTLALADLRSGMLTYSDVKMRVILLATVIRSMPGDSIGIMLPASAAASIVILATQLAGKVPVLINWTVGARHLEGVVEQSGIQKVITAWSFLDRLEGVDLTAIHDMLFLLEDLGSQIGIIEKIKAFCLSKRGVKRILASFSFDRDATDATAVVLFTSGTESLPKGVPLSHKNILSNQRAGLERLNVHQDDVLLSMLPPFHSFGFTIGSLVGLLAGFRTAFYPNPMEGPELARCLNRWNITILCGPPTFIRALLKSATQEEMEKIQLTITGAEKATPEFISLLEKFGKLGTWVEGYGITECAPVLTATSLNQPKVGVGSALRGVSILIRHPETLAPVAQGEDGLILVRGPNVFDGYLHNTVSSPFVNVEGQEWYKTGDLGNLDPQGNLTISGRLKRFFKIGGEMISLGAIEAALLEAAPSQGWVLSEEGPSLAVIVDEELQDKPRLILFTRFTTTPEEVNSALRRLKISNLVRIQEVHDVEAIPVMGTGKIHYRELQAQMELLKKKEATLFDTLRNKLPLADSKSPLAKA